MIWFLLACAGGPPADDTAAPADVVPDPGAWTVTWGQTYGGDCRLDDMSTRQPETAAWAIEAEDEGFTLRDEYDYPIGCDLDGDAFACSLGTYHVPWGDSGYDATEYVSTDIAGTFADPDHFDATYTIHAECAGDDCAEVGLQYGDDFTYPCSAIATFEGAFAGGP